MPAAALDAMGLPPALARWLEAQDRKTALLQDTVSHMQADLGRVLSGVSRLEIELRRALSTKTDASVSSDGADGAASGETVKPWRRRGRDTAADVTVRQARRDLARCSSGCCLLSNLYPGTSA